MTNADSTAVLGATSHAYCQVAIASAVTRTIAEARAKAASSCRDVSGEAGVSVERGSKADGGSMAFATDALGGTS